MQLPLTAGSACLKVRQHRCNSLLCSGDAPTSPRFTWAVPRTACLAVSRVARSARNGARYVRGGEDGLIPRKRSNPVVLSHAWPGFPACRCELETGTGSKCPRVPDLLKIGCKLQPVSRRKTAEAVLNGMAASLPIARWAPVRFSKCCRRIGRACGDSG